MVYCLSSNSLCAAAPDSTLNGGTDGDLYDDITAKCMPFNYNRLNNILPILPEAEKYESKLSALAEEKMMKMILDQGELDKFDEFVAQWKAEGGDELTNAYNAWYAEQD